MRRTATCATSLLLAVGLAGCGLVSGTSAAAPSVPCSVLPQQTYSRNDTDETRLEVVRRNAVIAALCPR